MTPTTPFAALLLSCAALLGQSAPRKPIRLLLDTFDPLVERPEVPAGLRAADDTHLWLVQCVGVPDDDFRARIAAAHGRICSYVPEHAYVVRADAGDAAALALESGVRAVCAWQPAFRLEPALRAEFARGELATPRWFQVVVADKHRDKPALVARIDSIGGEVVHEEPGSILMRVRLDSMQLLQLVRFDEVLYVDRWTAPSTDMDHARTQGGADLLESSTGCTGQGITGHVYEGLESTHPDFTHPPINVLSCGGAHDHGHCTAGIVFGNGTSAPQARGLVPDAQAFFTTFDCVTPGVSRWQVVQELVTTRQVMFTTASWGGALTRAYTTSAADADDIVFDHDIVWTQSQSNSGNQDSRPEAWAKNLISVGGVLHRDNADPGDDSWGGGGSTGPAADGRLKPDLCAYYDLVWCSDRTGTAGYSAGNSYPAFNGTSAATPIVAGYGALAMQLFTDGALNHPQRVPGGTRFQNRAHAATHKALMLAHARQYPFGTSSTDNRREQVGFGFPDLRSMWENRQRVLIVDEEQILGQGQIASHPATVRSTDFELKAVMCFTDPAGNPAAALAAVNDLSLRVTSPSGVVYWGNHGLESGNHSTAGGTANTIDTVECVFVEVPEAGTWMVDVIATMVALDGHVETPQVDADFGLCVSFGTPDGSITKYGSGCAGTGTTGSTCLDSNGGGGTLSNSRGLNEYAYTTVAPTALQVLGFEVQSQSTSGMPVTVGAAIYADVGGIPAPTPLATTTISIGITPDFWRATLASPLLLPAGRFHLGVDHSAGTTSVANLVSGTAGSGFYRRPAGSGAWAPSGVVRFPAFRVLCSGGGAPTAPVLDVGGSTALGGLTDHLLTRAAPSTIAFWIAGSSDSQWAGSALPWPLDALGAPGCALLASPDASFGFATGALGTVQFALVVPPANALIGLRLHEQFLVLDAGANQLGLATSNGVRLVLGR